MRRRLLWGAAAVAAVAVVVVAGWLLDRGGDRVVAGVEVGGRAVGGDDADEVGSLVEELAGTLEASEVTVRTPSGSFAFGAAQIGLRVDRAATVAAVLGVGDTGALPLRPLRWAWRLVRPEEVPLVVTVDRAAVAGVVADADPTPRVPAIEPALAVEDDVLVVRPGEAGRGVAASTVAAAVRDAAGRGRVPIVAEVEPERLAPRFSRRAAERLLGPAAELVRGGVEVAAGGVVARVPEPTLRSWLRLDDGGDELLLAFDGAAAGAALAQLLPGAGVAPVDASVLVVGGRPEITPDRPGTACCAPEAAGVLLDALRRGDAEPIDLPLTARPAARTTEDVARLGIVEETGSFTTRFPARQSRVVNIHRIADLVRGVVIEPGAQFSVNDHIGRRTAEKGFVPGGVIEAGVFAESIGGGISQFATTLFNAAFFGGLDIVEYRMHSLYISRYPYGREATLSYPQPDLVLRNGSPHGVLIWTEYTGTSVTVRLFSTRHATGEQTAQSTAPAGSCTRVRTERTRRYVDGSTKTDAFVATYRPAEGVPC